MNTTGKSMLSRFGDLVSYCADLGCSITESDIREKGVSRIRRRCGEFTVTLIFYRRKNGLWWLYWAKDNHPWYEDGLP